MTSEMSPASAVPATAAPSLATDYGSAPEPAAAVPTAPPATPEPISAAAIEEERPVEVHHHSHDDGKGHRGFRWREFVMLFLAVFLGSLGEYALEHYIESERAGQLARNLYSELKANDASLKTALANREKKERWLRDFAAAVPTVALQDPPLSFISDYSGVLLVQSATTFAPNDGMLEQLVNSGSLRYFRDDRLQAQIGDLIIATRRFRERQERERDLMASSVAMLLPHYDMAWMSRVTDASGRSLFDMLPFSAETTRDGAPRILRPESFDRDLAANTAEYLRLMFSTTRDPFLARYQAANDRLMRTLREIYALE
jgi:hypothetical protein